MRNPVPAYRFLGQAAIVTMVAVTVAGCSESSRFGQPLFTGSTDNQRQIISGDPQPMPQAVASAPVTQSYLPPPGGADSAAISASQPSYSGAQPSYSGGQPSYSAPQAASSALPPGSYEWTPEGVKPAGQTNVAAYAPPSESLASGRYTVAPGDTLYSIGRRHGVSAADIATMNGLASVEQIRVGQQLQIPGGTGHSIPSTAVAASTPSTSVASTVQPAAQPTVVASATPNDGILTHPNGQPAVMSAPSTTTHAEPRTIPGVPAVPSAPVETNAAPAPAPTTTAAIDQTLEPASADGTSFRWPVRGRIISGFGSKPNGERNDGINLAVPEGTTVKAAEAGTVIYAGNELEGYGKLVLIRHADDWVSAYAHNSDIKVSKGDTVRRGQTVATAGMSGSVSSPQVHFELRKKAKPVNPLDYLAGA